MVSKSQVVSKKSQVVSKKSQVVSKKSQVVSKKSQVVSLSLITVLSFMLVQTTIPTNEWHGIGLRSYYLQHMAGCFPEKLRWCLSEQICQGSEV